MLNILSLISFANAVFFIFLSIYSIITQPKSPINQASALECILLAIWSFSYTFFYVAPTKEAAWFWMKLGSFGWIGFMGALIWFFMELSRHNKNKYKTGKRIIIVIIPSLLTICNLFSSHSSVAVDFIQSKCGLGWTYVNHIGNVLLWFYVIYILTGVVICFVILHNWLKKTKSKQFRRLAIVFLIVDGMMICCGFAFDIIIPVVTDAIPPLTNIFLLFFNFSYWIIIFKLGVFEKTALEASEFIMDTISDALFVLDQTGVIIHCNQAASKLLQYDNKEILGNELIGFYKEDSYNQENLKILFSEKRFIHKETQLVAKDDSIIYVSYSASVAEDDIHGFMGVVISFHDITKQKKLENKLYELAHYDVLTGLPNRRYFMDVLFTFEDRYRKRNEDFAIFFMDLDGFKKINDTLGHDKGDLLLVEVGKRISNLIDEKDMVARIGGDEFVMLLSNIKEEEQVKIRKAKILNEFKKEIIIDNQNYPIGVSIGYTIYSEVQSISDLMRKADQCMYVEKIKNRD